MGPEPSPFQILETTPQQEGNGIGSGGAIGAATSGSSQAIDAKLRGPALALGAIISVVILSIVAIVYRRHLTLKDNDAMTTVDFQDCDDDRTTPSKDRRSREGELSIVSNLGGQFWEFGGSTPVSKEKGNNDTHGNGASRYDPPETSPMGNTAPMEDEEEEGGDDNIDAENNKKDEPREDGMSKENASVDSIPFMVVNKFPSWFQETSGTDNDNINSPAMAMDLNSVSESQFTTEDEWRTIGGDDSTFQYSTSGKTFGSEFV
jgi:hypothetical protein